jgi:RNA polymerase sigma-70 factor, ECF subfamily
MLHDMRAADEVTLPEEPAASSFEGFFEREHVRLVRALYALTGSQQEADDIAQDALVRVWERWERVRTMANPTGYRYRTAMNAHRSRVRRAIRLVRRLTSLRGSGQPDELGDVEERDRVARAMASLPARQRAAVVLIEFLEFDSAEAGAVLGVAPTTVRNLASQARRTLQRELVDTDE